MPWNSYLIASQLSSNGVLHLAVRPDLSDRYAQNLGNFMVRL